MSQDQKPISESPTRGNLKKVSGSARPSQPPPIGVTAAPNKYKVRIFRHCKGDPDVWITPDGGQKKLAYFEAQAFPTGTRIIIEEPTEGE